MAVLEAAPIIVPKPLAGQVLWIDHFDLSPGDPTVSTSSNAVSSGVGGGLTGLVIRSTTTGSVAKNGGNKVVQTAVEVPLGFTVIGVRVCYELTSSRSFITQIRLSQVQNPPSSAAVHLDDATQHTAVGPVCVESTPTSIDPQVGPLLLDLRLNYGNVADEIVIRGVGLRLTPKA